MSQATQATLGGRVRQLSRALHSTCGDEDSWSSFQKFLNLAFGPPINSSYDLTLGPASRQPLTWSQEYFLQALPQRLEEGRLPERVLGLGYFFGFPFALGDTCLIPRPDSEVLVAEALAFLKEKIRQKLGPCLPPSRQQILLSSPSSPPFSAPSLHIKILDACVGSGCLGISLVRALLDWINDTELAQLFQPAKTSSKSPPLTLRIDLWGFDQDPSCVSYAKMNAAYLIEKTPSDGLVAELGTHYFVGDLFDQPGLLARLGHSQGKEETFDVFLANPPYISRDELDEDGEVLLNDPRSALEAAEGGLACYPPLLDLAKTILGHPGLALFEHGWTQGDQVLNLAQEHWVDQANTKMAGLQDLGGRNRAVKIQR